MLGVLQVLDFGHFRAFQRVDFSIDVGQRLLVHGAEVLAARLLRDLLQRRLVDVHGAWHECRAAEEIDGRRRSHAARAGPDAVHLDVALLWPVPPLSTDRSRPRW